MAKAEVFRISTFSRNQGGVRKPEADIMALGQGGNYGLPNLRDFQTGLMREHPFRNRGTTPRATSHARGADLLLTLT